jgi:hypothetical protein
VIFDQLVHDRLHFVACFLVSSVLLKNKIPSRPREKSLCEAVHDGLDDEVFILYSPVASHGPVEVEIFGCLGDLAL